MGRNCAVLRWSVCTVALLGADACDGGASHGSGGFVP